MKEVEKGLESLPLRELHLDEIKRWRSKKGYLKVPDRREAIRTAIRLAQLSDTVLIAGKGHEDYQIIGKRRFLSMIASRPKKPWRKMILTIEEVLKITGETLSRGKKYLLRSLYGFENGRRRDLFIALKGPRFDGHHYALEALRKKAGGVLIEEDKVGDIRWNGIGPKR